MFRKKVNINFKIKRNLKPENYSGIYMIMLNGDILIVDICS